MTLVLRYFLKFLDGLDLVVKWFCTIAAGAMATVVLVQVVSRYLPIPTPPWTEELARYLMIYMAFVGASTGIRKWNNISVDFLLLKLPPKLYRIVLVSMQLIVLGLVLYLGILGLSIFPRVGLRQLSATMGFPMLVPQSGIIIGCFLMSLQLGGVLLKPFVKEDSHV